MKRDDLAARKLTDEEMEATHGGVGFVVGVLVGWGIGVGGVALGLHLGKSVKAEAPDLSGIPASAEEPGIT